MDGSIPDLTCRYRPTGVPPEHSLPLPVTRYPRNHSGEMIPIREDSAMSATTQFAAAHGSGRGEAHRPVGAKILLFQVVGGAGWAGGFEFRNSETPKGRRQRSGRTSAHPSNFPCTKDWTSVASRACVLATESRPVGLSGISPRWPCCHCGASVVTAPDVVPTKRIPKCRNAKSLAT